MDEEVNEVLAALAMLDGSLASAVCLLAGITPAELDELGGVTEE